MEYIGQAPSSPGNNQLIAPPTLAPRWGDVESRPVQDVLLAPSLQFYNPDDLIFRDVTMPTVPGGPPAWATDNLPSGRAVSNAYAGYIQYDEQASWCRSYASLAGPVRQFFRAMLATRAQSRHV